MADKHNRKRKIPQLLVPAGGSEQLCAAIANGADAVYMGGSYFNARAGAENFSDEELEDAIKLAHEYGLKVHIALNTLVKDDEMRDAVCFAEKCAGFGADAFILQDRGLARLLMRELPECRFHLSTQATVYDEAGVKEAENAGFSRVILSRELSAEEIRKICQSSNIELEIFVHGAICVSYSGQCRMSYAIGGRSGNRGRCAQPCRLPYELYSDQTRCNGNTGNYILSPADMCLADHLGEIADAGVASLKIEGRMKSPQYVAVVTKIYRRHLDLLKSGTPRKLSDSERRQLLAVFNRGGMTDAYFRGDSAGSLMSSEIPKHMGILVGRVTRSVQNRNLVEIKLCDALSIGDGIEIRWRHSGAGKSLREQDAHGCGNARERGRTEFAGAKEDEFVTGNVVTYINGGGKMLWSAGAGQTVTVGDIKGRVRTGANVYKITDSALMKAAEESYRKLPGRVNAEMYFFAYENAPAKLTVTAPLFVHEENGRAASRSNHDSFAISAGSEPGEERAKSSACNEQNENAGFKGNNVGKAREKSAGARRLSVTVESGAPLETAQKHRADEEQIKKQLKKTGQTPYIVTKCRVNISGNPMIPLSLINAMRREALEKLTALRVNSSARRKLNGETATAFSPCSIARSSDAIGAARKVVAPQATENAGVSAANTAARVQAAATVADTKTAAQNAVLHRVAVYFYDTHENERKIAELLEKLSDDNFFASLDAQQAGRLTYTLTRGIALFVPYRTLLEENGQICITIAKETQEKLSAAAGQKCALKIIPYLPAITKGFNESELRADAQKLAELYAEGKIAAAAISNRGHELLFGASRPGMPLFYEDNMHLYNSLSVDDAASHGACGGVISEELSDDETEAICRRISENENGKPFTGEITVFGRIPVMYTEHCVIGCNASTGGKCSAKRQYYHCARGSYELHDRKGASFPVIADSTVCTAEILSHKKRDRFSLWKKITKLTVHDCGADPGAQAQTLAERGCEADTLMNIAARIRVYDESPDEIVSLIKKLGSV